MLGSGLDGYERVTDECHVEHAGGGWLILTRWPLIYFGFRPWEQRQPLLLSKNNRDSEPARGRGQSHLI